MSRTALLLSAFAAVFAAAAGTHALTPIFPELARALGRDAAEVRLLTSVYTLGYAAAGLLLGPLSDRVGRRAVLLPALAAYAGASLLLFLDPGVVGFVGFLVLRALAGVAVGGITATVVALVSDVVEFERRGRALSFVLAGSFVAVVLGVPLSGLLAVWRLTAIFGVLAAVALLAFLGLRRSLLRAEPSAAHGAVTPRLPPEQGVFAHPGTRPALLVTFLNTFAAFAVLSSLADHVVARFDASLGERAGLFLVLGLASLFGALVAGWISDRLGTHRTVVWALAASLLLIPALLVASRPASFTVAAGLVAAVQAVRMGPFSALLTELVPARRRGRLLGFNGAASGIGLALGAWFSGWLYVRGGWPAAVSSALAAVSLSLLVFRTGVPALVGAGADGSGSSGVPAAADRGGAGDAAECSP